MEISSQERFPTEHENHTKLSPTPSAPHRITTQESTTLKDPERYDEKIKSMEAQNALTTSHLPNQINNNNNPRTIYASLILAITLLSTPITAVSMICYSPTSLLPLTSDCDALMRALVFISHLPSESSPKTWGRRLHDTASTQSLPKILYYHEEHTPGFSTCAVEVDVNPTDVWAVETFTLARVAFAAESIVHKCLDDNRLVGLATLGQTGKVQARIFRTNRPLVGSRGGDRVGVSLPVGGKGTLWRVGGEAARGMVLGGILVRNGTEAVNRTVSES